MSYVRTTVCLIVRRMLSMGVLQIVSGSRLTECRSMVTVSDQCHDRVSQGAEEAVNKDLPFITGNKFSEVQEGTGINLLS